MKVHITVGQTAKGEFRTLYCGPDGAKALALLQNPPDDIHEVAWFRQPDAWKQRTTEVGAESKDKVRLARLDAQKKEHEAAKAKRDAAIEAEAKKRAEAKAKPVVEIQNNPARVKPSEKPAAPQVTPVPAQNPPAPAQEVTGTPEVKPVAKAKKAKTPAAKNVK